MFRNDQWLKRPLPVPRHLDGHFAKFAFQRLPAAPITGISRGMGHRPVALMTQMRCQLHIHDPFYYQTLGKLGQETRILNQVLWTLVIRQDLDDQRLQRNMAVSCLKSGYTKFRTPPGMQNTDLLQSS